MKTKMIEGINKARDAYQAGRKARENGQLKSPPGGMNWEHQHWWLAGWNDRDIEIDGPETPAKPTRRKST